MAAGAAENEIGRYNGKSKRISDGDSLKSSDDECGWRDIRPLLGTELAVERLGFLTSQRNEAALRSIAHSEGLDHRGLAGHVRRARAVLRQSGIRDWCLG